MYSEASGEIEKITGEIGGGASGNHSIVAKVRENQSGRDYECSLLGIV